MLISIGGFADKFTWIPGGKEGNGAIGRSEGRPGQTGSRPRRPERAVRPVLPGRQAGGTDQRAQGTGSQDPRLEPPLHRQQLGPAPVRQPPGEVLVVRQPLGEDRAGLRRGAPPQGQDRGTDARRGGKERGRRDGAGRRDESRGRGPPPRGRDRRPPRQSRRRSTPATSTAWPGSCWRREGTAGWAATRRSWPPFARRSRPARGRFRPPPAGKGWSSTSASRKENRRSRRR